MLGTLNHAIEFTSANHSLATVLLLITLCLTIHKMKTFNILKTIKYKLLSFNYPISIDNYDYIIIQRVRICHTKLVIEKSVVLCALSLHKLML